jgi:lysophospholipase L1-like esterase
MYGELPQPDILYSSGGSIFGSPDGLYHDRGEVGHRLWSRLGEKSYGKIILIYGTNEMCYESDYFSEHYAAFLDRLQSLQPEARIWLCTAPPVNEALAQDEVLTNRNCQRINEVIRSLARERGLGLLDVWAFFADEKGSISSKDTWDGIHLTPESCLRWTKWMCTAVIQD